MEIVMFFSDRGNKKNDRNGRRTPTESGELAPGVLANIWISEDEARLHWSLSRNNPNGGDFRTFRPGDMLNVIDAHARLASILSTAPQVVTGDQVMLTELNKLLESVVEMGKASSDSLKVNGNARSVLLASPHR